MATDSLVSCKEQDFLDQDPEIRGQHYFCMSSVCPSDVLIQKDTFVLNKFLGHISSDLVELLEKTEEKFKEDKETIEMLRNIRERYRYVFDVRELAEEFKFFKNQNHDEIDQEFKDTYTHQTSVHGIKIRGVYDTLSEARLRAEKLSKVDKNFNIFIGEVGCWCPFNPNVDVIDSQEYSETQLNTLMKKYKESESMRESFYQSRMKSLQQSKDSNMNTIKETDENENENESSNGAGPSSSSI